MARTNPAAVWPDGVAVSKGDIRSWAAEVDARVIAQTVDEAKLLSIPDAGTEVKAIMTASYAGAGGGARYAYHGITAPAGLPAKAYFQTADGAYWKLASSCAPLDAFGAIGDGVTDDTTALQDALDWAVAVGLGEVSGRPNAEYKVTSTLAITGPLRFTGASRRAKLSFVSATANAALIKVGDGTTRVEDVTIDEWRVETSQTCHVAVRAEKTTGLRVCRMKVKEGQLLHTELASSSAGKTGASWNASQPNIALIVDDDLNHDVEVRDNIARGDNTAMEGGENGGVIRLRYVRGGAVQGNRIRDYQAKSVGGEYISGIVWNGGDAGLGKDGAFDAVRWCSELQISGNSVDNVSAGGIWGANGKDIAIAGNTVRRCLDIGIHSEGGETIAISGNAGSDCKNGVFGAFFFEKGSTIVGNSARITDPATWGTILFKWNMGASEDRNHILVADNTFEMDDVSLGYGVVEFQLGGKATFSENTLRNVVLDGLSTNVGVREFNSNRLMFDLDTGADFDAISVGTLTMTGASGGEATASLSRNRIEVIGFEPTPGSRPIYIRHASANGNQRPSVDADDNRILGYYEAGTGAPKGWSVDIVTETTLSVGIHTTRLARNKLWAGKIRDITDGEGLGISFYGNRVMEIDSLSALPSTVSPYAAGSGPQGGVWSHGARGIYDAPAAGGSIGFVATSAGGVADVAGAVSGVYSSASTYNIWDCVEGSDGKAYCAIIDVPAGAANDPVSGASRASYWRRFAGDVAALKDYGAIAA